MAYIRRYENQTLQNAYENACDCHYYGMGSRDWNDCGIPQERRAEVWKVAFWDMAEGDNYTDKNRPTIAEIMAY